MTVDNATLIGPPVGHNCERYPLMVAPALAGVGARLNGDEIVVYNNDAIRRPYLVIYNTRW